MRTRSMTRNAAAQSEIGPELQQRAQATHIAMLKLEKARQLFQAEQRLMRSCETVVILNDRIYGLSKRYMRARRDNFKSFRYNNRIRLAVLEGVRNMYYEFARDRAEEVAELRKDLYNQNVSIITASDDDDDFIGSDSDFTDVSSDDDMEPSYV